MRLCKIFKEVSIRLSKVKLEQVSCTNALENHDDDDDIIITQCWDNVVDGKHKRRLYGTRQLIVNYNVGRDTLKHQPSTSSSAKEVVVHLTQQFEACDHAYDDLRQQFVNFQNLVMGFLSPKHKLVFNSLNLAKHHPNNDPLKSSPPSLATSTTTTRR